MTLWWQTLLLLLCYTLTCVSSIPSAVLHTKYINSFKITQVTKYRVQQLLVKYKEEQLGSRDFEDRSQHLKDLPLLSTNFYIWLKLTDRERLGAALWDLQTFRSMLEWKRKQLYETQPQNPLLLSFTHLQAYLRDLMEEVKKQMHYIGGPTLNPTSSSLNTSNSQRSRTQWDSRVEGYIILRDLDMYLTKLARDFLLLATKATHTDTQTAKHNRKL